MSYPRNFDLDEVDWAAVARAYRILKLYPETSEGGKHDEKLYTDYHDWLTESQNRIEFQIASKMLLIETEGKIPKK